VHLLTLRIDNLFLDTRKSLRIRGLFCFTCFRPSFVSLCRYYFFYFVAFPCLHKSKKGRPLFIRINVRGPHSRKRLIDLSRVAAKDIGLIPYGFSMVHIKPVKEKSQIDYLNAMESAEIYEFEPKSAIQDSLSQNLR